MAEHEGDIISKVRATEVWKEWGRRYQRQLRGLGKEPFNVAEAHLVAIPPDTYDSLMDDLQEGTDTLPFSKIVEELSPEQIEAVLEHSSAFGNVAVMQFFKKFNG
jgi:hypothetical protein